LKTAFAGSFAVRLIEPVRRRLAIPCEIVSGDEVSILDQLGGPERLDELLGRSDYLAITLPLSAETRCLIDARRLGLMKPSAYLINVARVEIFDEHSLYEALASGRLAGAALDVWYRYPISAGSTAPATAPFHELRNVIMRPHVSGWTEGMIEARAGVIAENVARTARGENPVNAIVFAD
jgi:phosphoglycerate dehydrogenase-like enzyme